MCGRFSTTAKEQKLEERFDARFYSETIEKRYNVAPTERSPIITNRESEKIQLYRWGLIPFWAKDPAIGNKMINARSETLFEKASFKEAVRKKRCLVLSDGFYEWKKSPMGKIPYRITRPDGEPWAYAGLWDGWKNPEGEIVHSFTIITVPPNKMVEPLHNRMPAILLPEHEKLWLAEDIKDDDIIKLLNPYPDDLTRIYSVSQMVNSPLNEDPELIEPVDYELF